MQECILWFIIFLDNHGIGSNAGSIDASLPIRTTNNCTVVNTVASIAHVTCLCARSSSATSLSETNSPSAKISLITCHSLTVILAFTVNKCFPTSACSTSCSSTFLIFSTNNVHALINALSVNKFLPRFTCFFNAGSSFAFFIILTDEVFALVNTLISDNLFP